MVKQSIFFCKELSHGAIRVELFLTEAIACASQEGEVTSFPVPLVNEVGIIGLVILGTIY